MPFRVQSKTEAVFPEQAQIHPSDLAILAAGQAGAGVLSGCEVTAIGGLSVQVAAGVIVAGGKQATIALQNVSIAGGTMMPRFDMVVANNTGAVSVISSRENESPQPPDLASGKVALAVIHVRAMDPSIEGYQITDKRVFVRNNYTGVFNVLDYGATGDGVTDDTTAIQNSLDSILSGGVVLFPPGTYKITSQLSLPFNANHPAIGIYGSGKESTILSFSLTSGSVGFSIGMTQNRRNVTIRDLTIRGVSNLKYGIQHKNTAFCRFENLNIDGFTETGVRGETGNNQNVFEQVRVVSPPIFGFVSFGVANRWHNCIVSGGSSASGFRIQDAGAIYNGCIADGCNYGFDIAQYAYSITLTEPHTENCNRGIHITSGSPPPQAVRVFGGLIVTSKEPNEAAVMINTSNRTSIIGLNVRQTTSGSSIHAKGNAQNVQVFNCHLEDGVGVSTDPGATVTTY